MGQFHSNKKKLSKSSDKEAFEEFCISFPMKQPKMKKKEVMTYFQISYSRLLHELNHVNNSDMVDILFQALLNITKYNIIDFIQVDTFRPLIASMLTHSNKTKLQILSIFKNLAAGNQTKFIQAGGIDAITSLMAEFSDENSLTGDSILQIIIDIFNLYIEEDSNLIQIVNKISCLWNDLLYICRTCSEKWTEFLYAIMLVCSDEQKESLLNAANDSGFIFWIYDLAISNQDEEKNITTIVSHLFDLFMTNNKTANSQFRRILPVDGLMSKGCDDTESQHCWISFIQNSKMDFAKSRLIWNVNVRNQFHQSLEHLNQQYIQWKKQQCNQPFQWYSNLEAISYNHCFGSDELILQGYFIRSLIPGLLENSVKIPDPFHLLWDLQDNLVSTSKVSTMIELIITFRLIIETQVLSHSVPMSAFFYILDEYSTTHELRLKHEILKLLLSALEKKVVDTTNSLTNVLPSLMKIIYHSKEHDIILITIDIINNMLDLAPFLGTFFHQDLNQFDILLGLLSSSKDTELIQRLLQLLNKSLHRWNPCTFELSTRQVLCKAILLASLHSSTGMTTAMADLLKDFHLFFVTNKEAKSGLSSYFPSSMIQCLDLNNAQFFCCIFNAKSIKTADIWWTFQRREKLFDYLMQGEKAASLEYETPENEFEFEGLYISKFVERDGHTLMPITSTQSKQFMSKIIHRLQNYPNENNRMIKNDETYNLLLEALRCMIKISNNARIPHDAYQWLLLPLLKCSCQSMEEKIQVTSCLGCLAQMQIVDATFCFRFLQENISILIGLVDVITSVEYQKYFLESSKNGQYAHRLIEQFCLIIQNLSTSEEGIHLVSKHPKLILQLFHYVKLNYAMYHMEMFSAVIRCVNNYSIHAQCSDMFVSSGIILSFLLVVLFCPTSNRVYKKQTIHMIAEMLKQLCQHNYIIYQMLVQLLTPMMVKRLMNDPKQFISLVQKDEDIICSTIMWTETMRSVLFNLLQDEVEAINCSWKIEKFLKPQSYFYTFPFLKNEIIVMDNVFLNIFIQTKEWHRYDIPIDSKQFKKDLQLLEKEQVCDDEIKLIRLAITHLTKSPPLAYNKVMDEMEMDLIQVGTPYISSDSDSEEGIV